MEAADHWRPLPQRQGLTLSIIGNGAPEWVMGDVTALRRCTAILMESRDKQLRSAARVRAGLVPLTRRQAFERIKPPETAKYPFVNLPEEAGRWGQGLTAEKMKECVWVKPQVGAEIEFLEWTGADHLRHSKFFGLRDDEDPCLAVRET
jgi:ATP-dependent DNA ligase